MMLDLYSRGGERTDEVWDRADKRWRKGVEELAHRMSIDDAMRVAVYDFGETLLREFQTRRWVFDDTTGRWRPPAG
jgi:hypothetical protein